MDTLATALYVKTDDLLKKSPQLAPYRPKTGIDPKLAGAELVTLAVMQALMGFTSEARWLRYARAHLCHLFPYLPQQPGYNKRLRGAAPLIRHCIRALAASTASWTDDVWIVDSTPWSAAAPARLPNAPTWPEWAEYGYCASHSRYFCGLRLHLVTTLAGLPVAFALADAEADERAVPLAIFTADPDLTTTRPGQAPAGGKNYYGAAFETALADTGIKLLRPARHGEPRAQPHTCSNHRARSSNQSTTPQGPARPRTPRRPHTQRRDHPRLAAHPGPDRRHLAQRHHQPAAAPPARKSHSKSQRRPPSDDISRRGAEPLFAQFKCSVSPVEPRPATPRR